MERSTDDAFFVDAWRIEPALNRISKEGTVQQLDPRTMQVLVCLADRSGEVVKREELMDRVWGDVIVSENTLSSVIARLRKTLEDDWQNPRYIETISKSGYRLIAAVQMHAPEVTFLHGDSIPIMTVAMPTGVPDEAQPVMKKPTTSWLVPVLLAALVVGGVIVGALWWMQPAAPVVQLPIDPQPLLTLPGTEGEPTLSPDGTKIAFMWQGPNQDNWDLYVMLIGEDNPVRLTMSTDPEGIPAWSPDGQYLAFARGDMVLQTCSVFRVPVIGGQEVRLGDCGQGITSMDWSADGTHLVLSINVAPQTPPGLSLLNLETQEQRTLTEPPGANSIDRDPVFSPDNQQVAFRRRRQTGGYDAFVVPLAGGMPTQMTFDKRGSVGGVDWTPDGKNLLFSSSRDGEYRLWQLPLAGGEPTRMALNDYGLTELRHAREANRLVYRVMRDETDLWLLELDDTQTVQGSPRTVLSSTREELYPQFSPIGERIAFVSKRTGFYEVWTGRYDGTALIRHTDFQGVLLGAPRWSPDGQTLVFDASPEGHADLYVVDANSQFPRRLTNDSFDEINARFSRDGQSIYFSSNRSGQWEIWKMPAQGGAASEITQVTGFDAQESVDGRDLYFARADTVGLWAMPVQGGAARMVIPGIRQPDRSNWVVVESGIYFAQNGPQAIAFYDFASGDITPLHSPQKTISFIGPALSVSPDESLLLFGRIERSEDEIMLVDF